MPTCKACGRVALRHRSKNNVVCPVCGYEGKPGPPVFQRVREV